MPVPHRLRPRGSRGAVLGVLAGTLMTLAGLLPATAAAHPAGTYEITNYRHFAGLTQEVGSDEFYLVTINFQVQLGVANSLRVWGNSKYEIDDIDDEEYHAIDARMGQALFNLGAWSPMDMFPDRLGPIRTGGLDRGPWIYGSVTQLMESDTSPWRAINDVHGALVDSIRRELKVLESATPTVVIANAVAQGVIDWLDANNKTVRDDVIRNYVTGKATNVILSTLRNVTPWHLLRSLNDDVIGTPRATIVAGIEDFAVTLPIVGRTTFSPATSLNTAMWREGMYHPVMAGVPIPLPAGFPAIYAYPQPLMSNVVMALPTRQHQWRTEFKGDGARYQLYVRAGRVS